jgi:transcriptional regulator of acetoin/glycerol metabolism
MELFRSHDWPGNVRELEHVIEYACILCKSEIITLGDLPQDLLDCASLRVLPAGHANEISTEPVPKLSIAEALAVSDGNKAHAARLLGISRMTLYRHLESVQ